MDDHGVKPDCVGLLGTKGFLCPPFLDYQKQSSFSLQDPPWVVTTRSTWLLSGEWGSQETIVQAPRVLVSQGCTARCCHLISSLCHPMDCSPPGPSVHRILQARTLKWVAIPSPRDLPDPGMEPGPPASAGVYFTAEPRGSPCSTAPLKCFADAETPTRWDRLPVCCPQTHRAQAHWNQKADDWLQVTSPPTSQENVHELITPSLDHPKLQAQVRSYSLPPPSWDTQFWGHQPTVAPFAQQSKKANLFYVIQNSVS